MANTSHFFVNVFFDLHLFAFVVAGNAALCALLLLIIQGTKRLV